MSEWVSQLVTDKHSQWSDSGPIIIVSWKKSRRLIKICSVIGDPRCCDYWLCHKIWYWLQVRITCARFTSFDINLHQISFHLRLRWGGRHRQVDKDKKKSKRKESNAQPAHSHPDLGAELPASYSLTDWRGQKTQSRLILVFSTTNALPTDTGATE